MPKTLVVLPLELEHAALVEFFLDEKYPAEEVPGKANATYFPDLELLVAVGGQGKTQFALTTQYLVDTQGPMDFIIAGGAAGGLVETVNTGDVVIATEAVEHDFKKRFGGDAPAPRHFCCSDLEESIRKCTTPCDAFQIYVGPITGGDEDIVDAGRAKELHQQTDALCVAWEGPGGARVRSSTAFLSLKFVPLPMRQMAMPPTIFWITCRIPSKMWDEYCFHGYKLINLEADNSWRY